jgi:hypothetical protein
MKKILLSLSVVLLLTAESMAQIAYEYKIITTVESIIPMGLGRSRLIENTTEVDAQAFTTERKDGTDSNQGSVKRKDIKIDELNETKLLNFYSGIGINFQNIASNDAVVTSKLNQFAKEGWELIFVNSGVESDAGKEDGQGIFITRYIFRKAIK